MTSMLCWAIIGICVLSMVVLIPILIQELVWWHQVRQFSEFLDRWEQH